MSIRTMLVCFSMGALLTAQNRKVPLKNWPAPLYWQPSHAEREAARANADPAIRPPSPDAATPAGSLVFVAMTPCRVVDTRSSCAVNPALCSDANFGPPSLSPYPGSTRTFQIQLSTTCTIPSSAQAYSFNVTLIPNPLGSPGVGYLTLYPTAGSPNNPPTAVTLDDYPTGDIRNNAAIVPAGIMNGSVSAVTNGSGPDLVIDINGYFAPSTGITLAQGTAAAPSLSFAGDVQTGIFSSGAGSLSLTTGGTAALTVDSTGDVELPGSLRKGGTLFLHNRGGLNTAIGLLAQGAVTSGDSNTATGYHAMAVNSMGSGNTATGRTALLLNAAGNHNTANGASALSTNQSGSGNTAIGFQALDTTTGSENTALGDSAGQSITSGSNNIDIGNPGTSSDGTSANSGVIRIGTTGTQTSFFAAGIAGVTVSNAAAVAVDTTTGQLGLLAPSSRRYKEDIADLGDDSEGLLRLRPVKFRYKKPYADGSKPLDYGLIAEEVAEVYPELVVRNQAGQIETVQYHKLIPLLLNELQKMEARLAALEQVP